MSTADDTRPPEADADASTPEAPSAWGPDGWSSPGDYQRWQRRWEEEASRHPAEPLPTDGPVLSIVVPVRRPSLRSLEACVQSVIDQGYQRWELCLCDDGSADPALTRMMGKYAESDSRVLLSTVQPSGGVSLAINRALATASGAFVAILDPDDRLAPTALAELAQVVTTATDADVVYTDEDRFDEVDGPCQPRFKPDWDPDLLLSSPYLGQITAIRRQIIMQVGGCRPEFDGSHDFDLMLRATELARRVVHIPKVLCHRRRTAAPAQPGANDNVPDDPTVRAAARRALEDALQRRGIDGWVEPASFDGAHHVRRQISGTPTVSVIIPFRDQAAMTMACLRSLEQSPGFAITEVVFIDNGSTEPETRVLRRRLEDRPATRVLDYPGAFNWAAVNNQAAATCTTDMLLFLNNDIEASSEGWLHALVELGQRPEIGAVGARLVYPDGKVQHAGVVLGVQGIATHLFAGMPGDHIGYMGWDRVIRSYSALTGACMLVRRELFEEMEGFDEDYPIAFNDLDFCIRLTRAGYRLLYTPHAQLTHYESVSRGLSGYAADFGVFLRRWWGLVQGNDLCYNPNLGRFTNWCSLRQPGEDEQWLAEIGKLVPDDG